MDKDEYELWLKTPEHELLDIITETQGSQRGHLARYIMQRNSNKILERAAIWSAVAAGLSALTALILLFK